MGWSPGDGLGKKKKLNKQHEIESCAYLYRQLIHSVETQQTTKRTK